MTIDTLSDICRCGHARRFHRYGGNTVACAHFHTGHPEYYIGCFYFECDERYVVFRRDERGRLRALASEPAP